MPGLPVIGAGAVPTPATAFSAAKRALSLSQRPQPLVAVPKGNPETQCGELLRAGKRACSEHTPSTPPQAHFLKPLVDTLAEASRLVGHGEAHGPTRQRPAFGRRLAGSRRGCLLSSPRCQLAATEKCLAAVRGVTGGKRRRGPPRPALLPERPRREPAGRLGPPPAPARSRPHGGQASGCRGPACRLLGGSRRPRSSSFCSPSATL